MMFCSKCGFQNNQGDMFCKKCGTKLDNGVQQTQQLNNNEPVVQPQQGVNTQVPNNNPNNGNLNQNYVNNAVNPNMKKWAILSVVIPAVSIIWYWFIGLPPLIAVLLAATGFGFAKKGEVSDQKMATIGRVLNGILVGFAVVMYILYLLETFS